MRKKIFSLVFSLCIILGIFFGKSDCFATKNSPKLSVIIPVYNVESYVDECMESVVRQSYKNLEIICVNDGSTDKSRLIIEEYAKKDGRVKVINQNNFGVSEARNNGIDHASGEYITFVDPDDLLELNAYETAMRYLEREEIDILVWGYNVFPSYDTWYEKAGNVSGKLYNSDSINAYFSEKSSTVVWNKIYRSDLIKNHSMHFEKGLRYCEDVCFNLLVFPRAKKIKFISDKLYNYRIKREGSATTAFGRKIKLENQFAMFENVLSKWNCMGYTSSNESKLVSHFTSLAYNEIRALQGEGLKNFSIKFMNLMSKYIKKGAPKGCPLKTIRKIKYIKQSSDLI